MSTTGQGKAPSEQNSVFRDAVLRRLNSPEQFDERIRLIPPVMQLMALGVAAIIVAALVWAIFGSIPTRTSGRGILLSDGKGSFAVEPVTSGPITEVLVKQGDHVAAGTVIAKVQQASLTAQLKGAATRLAAVQEDLARLKAADSAILVKGEDIARRQQQAIDQEIAAAKARVERLSKLLSGFEDLRTKGLLTASSLVNMQQEYDQTILSIAHANARKIEVEAALQQKHESLAERRRQAQVAVDLVQAEVDRLQAELAIGSTVSAPIAGTIDELRVGVGDVVAPGTVIATIGEVSEVPQFQVVALFGGDMGKRVTTGMDVHVHPVTVRRAEHGAMVGRIATVTERSVSEREVNSILRNSTLTKTLMSDGAPVLARITLVETEETPSGFAWWVGKGPSYKITRGTLIEVEVIVSRHRPIALVIPAMRKLLGLEG